ncbi:MAG: hypothetical protein CMK07_14060 [Ponticaulis sp.]|nr:hypothetical protein [Ponticaulis sp.]
MIKYIATALMALFALQHSAMALPSSPNDYREAFQETDTSETRASMRAEYLADAPVRDNRCALRRKRISC